MQRTFDYVVLGAGFGGLAAAACLTRLGFRVAVLEQHYLAGGCGHTFEWGPYHFCADVHYLYQCQSDQTIGRFLRFIGRDVEFNSLDPECIDRVVTPEVDFQIPLGWEKFRARMLATYPDEAAAINIYFDEIQRIHDEVTQLTSEVRWYDRHWTDWLKLPKFLRLYRCQGQTLQDLYDHAGLSLKLQTLLAGQSGDYALPPDQIALLSHAALTYSYSEGAFYPRYHFQNLVDTMVEAIRDRGGEVLLSTPVEHIDVADGKIRSVTSGDTEYLAEKSYLSDLDPKLTVELMHGTALNLSQKERERLTSYDYSTSAFNIYFGLSYGFEPQRYGLGNWNIWYYPNSNLNDAYRRQLEGDLQRPWLFVSCPTMKSDEPGMAPSGDHVLEVATVCPYEPFRVLADTDHKQYLALKHEIYEQLMSSLRDLIPDIDRYIRKKVVGSPTTTERFLGQPVGNIYGARLVPRQVGLHRLGYRTELPNLMLVGATAGYPSVPGVINNGMDVVELLTGISTYKQLPPEPAMPATTG